MCYLHLVFGSNNFNINVTWHWTCVLPSYLSTSWKREFDSCWRTRISCACVLASLDFPNLRIGKCVILFVYIAVPTVEACWTVLFPEKFLWQSDSLRLGRCSVHSCVEWWPMRNAKSQIQQFPQIINFLVPSYVVEKILVTRLRYSKSLCCEHFWDDWNICHFEGFRTCDMLSNRSPSYFSPRWVIMEDTELRHPIMLDPPTVIS